MAGKPMFHFANGAEVSFREPISEPDPRTSTCGEISRPACAASLCHAELGHAEAKTTNIHGASGANF